MENITYKRKNGEDNQIEQPGINGIHVSKLRIRHVELSSAINCPIYRDINSSIYNSAMV